jgi:hypothetical protein
MRHGYYQSVAPNALPILVRRCPAATEPKLRFGDHHTLERIRPMKNEQTNAPTALTEEQTAMVSGGALNLTVARGCPACTSGRPMAFDALANIVNPATQFQAIG